MQNISFWRPGALLVGCSLMLLLCATVRGEDQPATRIPSGPVHFRVTWKGDAARQATVSWNTYTQGEVHRLKYRADGAPEWTTLAVQRSGKFFGKLADDKSLYYHHARLTQLEPATKYQVVCESDGHASRPMYFITAPAEDVPFSFLFGGDSRSGTEARRSINHQMANMIAEATAAGRPEILALAHGGDYIADGRKLSQWAEWMGDHELTIGSDGRLMPVIPTRGNHEPGPIFDQVFDFPEQDGNYYTVDLGPETRLVTLNTEISTAGNQKKWLAKELKEHRRNYRWYLAQYHKPAYPAVKVPSGAYLNWVPQFEKHRIDLAFEADGHNIKRTPPILNDKVDAQGVVYVGEGGLGVGQREPKTDRWYLRDTAAHCSVGHHVHLVTLYPDRLECRVVRLGGEVFDEFTLAPRDHARSKAKEPALEAATN